MNLILSRIKYINNTDSYINLFAFYGMLLDFSMKFKLSSSVAFVRYYSNRKFTAIGTRAVQLLSLVTQVHVCYLTGTSSQIEMVRIRTLQVLNF
jgi:hypothetical protein